jgi:hypothetical protein
MGLALLAAAAAVATGQVRGTAVHARHFLTPRARRTTSPVLLASWQPGARGPRVHGPPKINKDVRIRASRQVGPDLLGQRQPFAAVFPQGCVGQLGHLSGQPDTSSRSQTPAARPTASPRFPPGQHMNWSHFAHFSWRAPTGGKVIFMFPWLFCLLYGYTRVQYALVSCMKVIQVPHLTAHRTWLGARG